MSGHVDIPLRSPPSFARFNEAVLAAHSELNLDAALRRIVELARELVGARYAALGIVGTDGYLSDFITTGISDAERAAIGPLPRGHGILGVLIHEQRSLRLSDLRGDARSSGFPPHHPPMTSFLGVPIRLGEEAIGNFYLTDKQGAEEFSVEDENLVELLAEHAAVAVRNARRFTDTEMQRQFLRAIIEHMPGAVTIRETPGGRLLAANDQARALLGIATLPAEGGADIPADFRAERPSGQSYVPDQIPTMRALRTGEEVVDEELIVRDEAGRSVHYAVSAIPVHDAVGKATAVVSLIRDVTEAREAEQLKDDFLSLISHELRTPLTTIQGAASMLLSTGDELPQEARDALRMDLLNESERLSRMLKNMLALSAYEAGRLHVERDPFLIQPVLRQVAREVEARHPSHRARVVADRGLPPAEGDEELMTQAVRNLAENAAKYSPNGGTITLGAAVLGAEIIVSVSDEGPGIPSEQQEQIFQRFHRASTGTQGMGLGLYLCQRLVEAHGGRIWVESRPDEGATFRFTLPIAQETDE